MVIGIKSKELWASLMDIRRLFAHSIVLVCCCCGVILLVSFCIVVLVVLAAHIRGQVSKYIFYFLWSTISSWKPELQKLSIQAEKYKHTAQSLAQYTQKYSSN